MASAREDDPDLGIGWTLRLYGWFNCQQCRRGWQVSKVKATRVTKITHVKGGQTNRKRSDEQQSRNRGRKSGRANPRRYSADDEAPGAPATRPDYGDYAGPHAHEYDTHDDDRQQPRPNPRSSSPRRQRNRRRQGSQSETTTPGYRWVHFNVKIDDEDRHYKFQVMIEGRHACKNCHSFYFPFRAELLKCSECGLSVGCVCIRQDGRRKRNNDPVRQHRRDLCENCLSGQHCTYASNV